MEIKTFFPNLYSLVLNLLGILALIMIRLEWKHDLLDTRHIKNNHHNQRINVDPTKPERSRIEVDEEKMSD